MGSMTRLFLFALSAVLHLYLGLRLGPDLPAGHIAFGVLLGVSAVLTCSAVGITSLLLWLALTWSFALTGDPSARPASAVSACFGNRYCGNTASRSDMAQPGNTEGPHCIGRCPGH